MKTMESYEVRLEMAHMHESYIERLHKAIGKAQYVEVSWLCYAIFEQRIARIMSKHISKCPKGKRSLKDHPVSISTKILCLQKLTKLKYGPYQNFDPNLLKEINSWCKKRNDLIHGLVSLEHYKKYDMEFKELATSGVPLVEKLYQEATKVRDWCRDDNSFDKFPEIKCRCGHRCVFEE